MKKVICQWNEYKQKTSFVYSFVFTNRKQTNPHLYLLGLFRVLAKKKVNHINREAKDKPNVRIP